MRCSVLAFVVASLLSLPTASAQRDAPVWSSYLSRIDVYPTSRLSLAMDLAWKKTGGPIENKRHQMYLLAYLDENEDKILGLSKKKELTRKKSKEKQLLLDVLLEQKLVTVLETRTAKRRVGKYKNRTAAQKIAYEREVNSFLFTFQFQTQELFTKVSKLPGYNSKAEPDSGGYTWFMDKVRFLVFIPTNDSKYAKRVGKITNDFAWQYDHETIIQYFRPLPHRLIFKRLPNKEMLIYIN